ncbi:cytidine deaminase [Paraliobacillus zengyii]|uniref:cytidine deaminase n=1 Tax=Paraliobacillus zengyii TaxID=2213194 RepID=UPI000DD2E431|nr:cytidine deaminase [Paraliobacillus zengyii]
MDKETLIESAKEARKQAYIPYSKFAVGAALETRSGKVYLGCNIENAAYPVSLCAERVAIFKAISEGETEFKQLAVVADTDRAISPCGSCRQVMSEFFNQDVSVHITNLKNDLKTVTIDQLLPYSFQATDMK